MNEKGKLKKYLLWSFLIAWILQVTASILCIKGKLGLYQIVLSISMFAPFAAAILSGKEWMKVGFMPRIKGNVRWLFCLTSKELLMYPPWRVSISPVQIAVYLPSVCSVCLSMKFKIICFV